MSVDLEKWERFEGEWNGQAVHPKRVWCGHRFTDEEVEKLLNDEIIEINDAVSTKTGNTFTCKGKLEEQVHPESGNTFIAFKPIFDNSEKKPTTWCTHEFTESEVADLLAGKEVTCVDFVSKAGKAFKGTVVWDKEKGKIEFAEKKPRDWCKHNFTEQEQKDLLAGKEVTCSDFVGKSGRAFKAKVKWNAEEGKIETVEFLK